MFFAGRRQTAAFLVSAKPIQGQQDTPIGKAAFD
jgi:hypothetical protein